MFSFALSATSPSQPPSDSSVTAVVALARAGDQAAFTALFHQYNAPLCRYLAHLVGNDEVARDLTQETFFRAWQSLPTMRDEQRFAPWLYKIATNLARSYQRHARLVRWLPWAESDGEQARHIPGPERQVAEAELVALALARLTPKYRVCLLLQLEGGFSQREIAQLLHLTEKSVSVYVSRGRQQFLQAYQEVEQEEMPAQRKGGPNS